MRTVCLFTRDRAPPELYTLSLHDALPIFFMPRGISMSSKAPHSVLGAFKNRYGTVVDFSPVNLGPPAGVMPARIISSDRKSTRLNSSHTVISYAVFCLKKKRPPPAATTLR